MYVLVYVCIYNLSEEIYDTYDRQSAQILQIFSWIRLLFVELGFRQIKRKYTQSDVSLYGNYKNYLPTCLYEFSKVKFLIFSTYYSPSSHDNHFYFLT